MSSSNDKDGFLGINHSLSKLNASSSHFTRNNGPTGGETSNVSGLSNFSSNTLLPAMLTQNLSGQGLKLPSKANASPRPLSSFPFPPANSPSSFATAPFASSSHSMTWPSLVPQSSNTQLTLTSDSSFLGASRLRREPTDMKGGQIEERGLAFLRQQSLSRASSNGNAPTGMHASTAGVPIASPSSLYVGLPQPQPSSTFSLTALPIALTPSLSRTPSISQLRRPELGLALDSLFDSRPAVPASSRPFPALEQQSTMQAAMLPLALARASSNPVASPATHPALPTALSPAAQPAPSPPLALAHPSVLSTKPTFMPPSLQQHPSDAMPARPHLLPAPVPSLPRFPSSLETLNPLGAAGTVYASPQASQPSFHAHLHARTQAPSFRMGSRVVPALDFDDTYLTLPGEPASAPTDIALPPDPAAYSPSAGAPSRAPAAPSSRRPGRATSSTSRASAPSPTPDRALVPPPLDEQQVSMGAGRVALGSTQVQWRRLDSSHPALQVVRRNMQAAARRAAVDAGVPVESVHGPPSSDTSEQGRFRRAPAQPYSAEDRAIRLERWRAKVIEIRKSRISVKYLNRRKFAVQRERVGGRFVKRTDAEKRAAEEAKRAEKELKKRMRLEAKNHRGEDDRVKRRRGE